MTDVMTLDRRRTMGIPTKKHTAATATPTSPKVYRTLHPDVASALSMSGVTLINAEVEGHKIAFVFDDATGKATTLAREHAVTGIPCDSKTFASALRDITDLLWETKRVEGLTR